MLDYKTYFKRFLALAIISVVLITCMSIMLAKPSIHEATFEELVAIHDVGEVRATKVLEYLEDFPDAEIDDIINVCGIGETTLKRIKRRYE